MRKTVFLVEILNKKSENIKNMVKNKKHESQTVDLFY